MPRTIDLDSLEHQHAQERRHQHMRTLLETPRPMAVRLPADRPQSEAMLGRLNAIGIPTQARFIIDHLRSLGPWLSSVDSSPLVLFDASGRWCSSWGGFALGGLIRADIEGRFAHTTTTARIAPDPMAVQAHDALANLLRKALGLTSDVHMAFASTPREALEIAIHALRGTHPAPPLTFTDARFRLGHIEAPFPAWRPPVGPSPSLPEPEVLLDRVLNAAEGHEPFNDPLLNAEVASLRVVHEALSTGACCGCVLEPIQRQAGDHYATVRFIRALQALVDHHGSWLVLDETEIGFGAAGYLAWSHHLLGTASPDALVLHDPGGVGICLGRFCPSLPWADVEAALLQRTAIRLQAGIDHPEPTEIHDRLQLRLGALVERHLDLALNPRVRGATLTFTLSDSDVTLRDALFEAMFARGLLADRTGQGTLSLHLPLKLDRGTTTRIFQQLEHAIAHLLQAEPPPSAAPRRSRHLDTEAELRVRVAGPEEADAMVEAVMELERQIFEPARRDPAEKLRVAFEHPYGSALIAELHQPDGRWTVVGYALGYPLEHPYARHLDGPDRDVMLDRHNTLYSAAISISSSVRGRGLGRKLKIEQLRHAHSMKRPDGALRYRYVTGRNRVGMTQAMTRINQALGAHTLCILTHQYGDPDGQALYYRIPLQGAAPDPDLISDHAPLPNLSHGIVDPWVAVPESLRQLHHHGRLHGPLMHGLDPYRDPTPDAIHAMEWLQALTPHHPGLTLAPSRDATLSMALDLLRPHRPSGAIAVGIEGGYLGHTLEEVRSVTDPKMIAAPNPIPTPHALLPHPNQVDRFHTALDGLLEETSAVLGLVVEAVQERTGRPLSPEGWATLVQARKRHGIPIVLVETASARYRSGQGPLASSGWQVQPDLVAWWGGGQIGVVHSTVAYPPQASASMGRSHGGELALIRVHHQLLQGRRFDPTEALKAMEHMLAKAESGGMTHVGLGLYRVVTLGAYAPAVLKGLDACGLQYQVWGGDRLVVAPALDRAIAVIDQLGTVLDEVVAA